jgi:glycosyltransferase involved in cell wall biosynthesis
MLESGVEAILVPPGDGPALSGSILRLLENRALAAALGAAARQKAIRQHSLSRVAARYLALFEQLGGARRGGG